MTDAREEFFESLFEIAETYNIPLTNNPDMHREMPSAGDFCGDVESAALEAGYVKTDEAALERAAKVLNPRAWNDSAVFLVPFGRTVEEVQRKDRDKARDQARAVIAALKGDA